ncbi:MAG: DUF2628 domain-containing protein [Rhodospirillales bacterium]|nr:DUF2628 domain-containing protein [Rhodospirillales bacterium]MDH3792505.1 DUF2628 domain-containing protein [Rhodospirillales bacterium]MDH3911110.1 DUF2628 domain-containing protein [Rhodospirillales bacterium]MDH3918173.1 DUF2628 domain-containing protein [Rhodospirillales bacterium]MDH3967346.1 DUF2628 domain-containing protein [Rhodospirillales bacterium]
MAGLPGNINEEELRAFIGPNAEGYLDKWRSIDYGRKSKIAVNGLAGIFGPFWMVYRKFYLLLLAYLGVVVLQGTAEILVLEYWLGWRDLGQVMTLPTAVLYMVILGCYANYWYFLYACRMIRRVRSGQGSDEHDLERIRRKGGVSWPAVIVLVSAIVGLLLLADYLATFS